MLAEGEVPEKAPPLAQNFPIIPTFRRKQFHLVSTMSCGDSPRCIDGLDKEMPGCWDASQFF